LAADCHSPRIRDTAVQKPWVRERAPGKGFGMAETEGTAAPGERVVIKKYANRRLYNTASSSYVTLEHLSEMVKQNIDFVVYDAKTNEDITRSVLTQIIFEEESQQGQSLLPIQFLRQLIGFYGNSMQAFLPSYLELSLASFTQQQERMRAQFQSLGHTPGAGVFDEQVRQNLALFDRAMKMFSPFAYAKPEEPSPPPAPRAQPTPPADDALVALRKQMEEMQAQIEKLAGKN
jgi:polyhydroxyalkanoate synthesis repressor PhaR